MLSTLCCSSLLHRDRLMREGSGAAVAAGPGWGAAAAAPPSSSSVREGQGTCRAVGAGHGEGRAQHLHPHSACGRTRRVTLWQAPPHLLHFGVRLVAAGDQARHAPQVRLVHAAKLRQLRLGALQAGLYKGIGNNRGWDSGRVKVEVFWVVGGYVGVVGGWGVGLGGEGAMVAGRLKV